MAQARTVLVEVEDGMVFRVFHQPDCMLTVTAVFVAFTTNCNLFAVPGVVHPSPFAFAVFALDVAGVSNGSH